MSQRRDDFSKDFKKKKKSEIPIADQSTSKMEESIDNYDVSVESPDIELSSPSKSLIGDDRSIAHEQRLIAVPKRRGSSRHTSPAKDIQCSPQISPTKQIDDSSVRLRNLHISPKRRHPSLDDPTEPQRKRLSISPETKQMQLSDEKPQNIISRPMQPGGVTVATTESTDKVARIETKTPGTTSSKDADENIFKKPKTPPWSPRYKSPKKSPRTGINLHPQSPSSKMSPSADTGGHRRSPNQGTRKSPHAYIGGHQHSPGQSRRKSPYANIVYPQSPSQSHKRLRTNIGEHQQSPSQSPKKLPRAIGVEQRQSPRQSPEKSAGTSSVEQQQSPSQSSATPQYTSAEGYQLSPSIMAKVPKGFTGAGESTALLRKIGDVVILSEFGLASMDEVKVLSYEAGYYAGPGFNYTNPVHRELARQQAALLASQAGQDNAGQDNAGQDDAGQDDAGQDNAGQDNVVQEQSNLGSIAIARVQTPGEDVCSSQSPSESCMNVSASFIVSPEQPVNPTVPGVSGLDNLVQQPESNLISSANEPAESSETED